MGVGAGALEAWPQAGEFHTCSQPTNISSSQSGRRLPAESLPPHQAAALSQTDLPLSQGEAPQPLQLESDPTPAQVTAKPRLPGDQVTSSSKRATAAGLLPRTFVPRTLSPPQEPHTRGVSKEAGPGGHGANEGQVHPAQSPCEAATGQTRSLRPVQAAQAGTSSD